MRHSEVERLLERSILIAAGLALVYPNEMPTRSGLPFFAIAIAL